MTQASAMNNGKRIGLLRGAGTRFATWFYALHRLLRQKKALLATVHSPYFTSLAHNAKTALAVQDIESNQFWKAVYFLLRAVFPALRALRYCDANKPAMDKIYYLCDHAEKALLRSNSLLSDYSLFGFLEEEFTEGVDEELEEVFGCTKDDLNENEVLNLPENER